MTREADERLAKIQQGLNERLFRVQQSHERAVCVMNQIARHVGRQGLRTNRHPGSDEQHVELSLEAATALANLLDAAASEGRQG